MDTSIIVPVYNAPGFILRTLGALDDFLVNLHGIRELIIVDDGSSDGTKEKLLEWIKPQRSYLVRFIPLENNLGKGGAVAAGMLAAKGKYRIFLDADLAYPPDQILRILKVLEDGADVAVANRVHADSRYTISPAFFHYLYTRHLASRLINWFMRHTIIPRCSDSQAGLKGFTAAAAEKIFSQQIIKGFPFDIEVLYLARKMKMRVDEVAVEYRYFNEPTTVVFMQDGISMLKSVARIHIHSLSGRYKLGERDAAKKLIMSADDFGMTLPISRGILKTVESGIVRQTSAMSNSPDFDASMDELTQASVKPRLGFHAVLTWGRPILDPKEIPTVVDKDGKFLSKGRLLVQALLGKISEDEVYKELHAQCERLKTRYPDILHMDSHHHVHVFPIIRKAAEKVARGFGIKKVRAPYEGIWSTAGLASARRWSISFFAASRPTYWRGRGFETADYFGGFGLGAGKGLKDRWLRTIENLPYGTTEIMAHPGYFSDNKDGYNSGREDEISVLCDTKLIGRAVKSGVEII